MALFLTLASPWMKEAARATMPGMRGHGTPDHPCLHMAWHAVGPQCRVGGAS
jgi:hypothetical protein